MQYAALFLGWVSIGATLVGVYYLLGWLYGAIANLRDQSELRGIGQRVTGTVFKMHVGRYQFGMSWWVWPFWLWGIYYDENAPMTPLFRDGCRLHYEGWMLWAGPFSWEVGKEKVEDDN